MKISVSAVAVLALAVPAFSVLGSSPALASAAECRTATATLVGTPGQVLVGTDGPDVVVTNGGKDVDTRAGDDVICVTGSTFHVVAGSGNDVVDATGSTRSTNVYLGQGDDTFAGGEQASKVVAGQSKQPTGDEGIDVIRTGSADDRVWSGSSGAVNADRVFLKGGDDRLTYFGTMADTGHVELGPGLNDLELSPDSSGTYRIDTTSKLVSLEGRPRMSWSGHAHHITFVELPVDPVYAGTLVFRGSSRADYLTVLLADQFRTVARMGGGDDFLSPGPSGKPGTVFVGGSGSDTIAPDLGFRPGTEPLVSLRDEVVDYDDPARPDAVLKGFDNVRLNGLMDVTVIGDERDNHVFFQGCQVRFRGLAGDDIFRSERTAFACVDSAPFSLLRGGPGHDVLYGQQGDDVLVGGAGPDVAYGRGGKDTCAAERTKDCES